MTYRFLTPALREIAEETPLPGDPMQAHLESNFLSVHRGGKGQRWCQRIWTVLTACGSVCQDILEFPARVLAT